MLSARDIQRLILRLRISLRKAGLARQLMAIGYGLSLIVTGLIVWLIIAAPGTGPIGPTSRSLFWLSLLNLGVLLLLSFVSVRRIFLIWRDRSEGAGSRLHLRFVTLFALAAFIPAAIVAIFFGVLVNRGVETWFSARVKASVDNGARVAKAYLNEEQGFATDTITKLANDIEKPEAKAQFNQRLSFSSGLQYLLAVRGGLSAIYVIDRSGQVLARAETPDAPSYLAPPIESINWVIENNQGSTDFNPNPDTVRILYPLQDYNGALLYGVRVLPDNGILGRLKTASRAIVELNEVSNNAARVQGVFALAYIETVLLVLVAAIWGGTSAAESISVPVAQLVRAADLVAAGDLGARVPVSNSGDEIGTLSLAFNRMTSDLQAQQAALKSAGEEAISRRRFIETVLSEISAGIVGLGVDGRVSAINRHAAQFLGVNEEAAIGQAFNDIAPELLDLIGRSNVQKVEEDEVDLSRDSVTRRLRVRISALETGGSVLTFDDITRLIVAQRNAAWKDVARRIAHEIKNPLTPIQLSAERIRRKYRDQITGDIETFDRCVETIVRHVGDIGHMVDEFSTFARMPVPNFSNHDLSRLIREAVFTQRVAKPDIAIEIVEPIPVARIICDDRLLAQAIGNILKNAGEAISALKLNAEETDYGTNPVGTGLIHEPKGQIRIEMSLIEDNVRIAVEDNGIGLPEKDRDRLTEPYVTTREKGTGLGLAIVKRIIEDHKGEFSLMDAETLSGAMAVILLPLAARSDTETTLDNTHLKSKARA